MIIISPTGLYRTVLPKPDESGNISYTISNNLPPRSIQTFLQLPDIVAFRESPDRIYTKLEKREFKGQLVFDVTIPGLSTEDSTSQQFEIGQVIEFTDAESPSTDPYELDSVEIRQDTFVVDFERHGLSKEDAEELIKQSTARMDELTKEISDVGNKLKDNSGLIKLNQADINQAAKLLANIILIQGEDSSSANKVRDKLDGYMQTKSELLEDRDRLQTELQVLRDEQQRIRETVR